MKGHPRGRNFAGDLWDLHRHLDPFSFSLCVLFSPSAPSSPLPNLFLLPFFFSDTCFPSWSFSLLSSFLSLGFFALKTFARDFSSLIVRCPPPSSSPRIYNLRVQGRKGMGEVGIWCPEITIISCVRRWEKKEKGWDHYRKRRRRRWEILKNKNTKWRMMILSSHPSLLYSHQELKTEIPLTVLTKVILVLFPHESEIIVKFVINVMYLCLWNMKHLLRYFVWCVFKRRKKRGRN